MKQILTKLTQTQKALLALVLILPAPLIGVSSSFYFPNLTMPTGKEIEVGKIIWAVAKIWLMALPVAWLLFVDRGKLSWSPTNAKGVFAGFLWAIPMSAVIFFAYWIAKGSLVDQDAKQTIENLGITTPAKFLIFASAMSLGNSLMEEYVWRWFVFTKFKILVGAWPAILLSSFFFTVHHIVIMWDYGSIWLVIAGSLSLFVGGVIWGYLYNKYNSIWPSWICHVAADSAIMWVTWQIITRN
ncbi:MAG: CPBP family intramembrane metalloprotease [Planctomycetes bacterium]|nr:CPBP family intramembrane metalloprotease [Planctomycetota bacterium]